jgi:uncharacterized protein (DUF1697 family)
VKTYIALFRGINVGGNNKLPMKELAAVLEGIGLRSVETYIQSGNVVFQGKPVNPALLSKRIGAVIGKSHGFEPWVRLLDMPTLEQVIRGNPYPEAEAVPGTLYVNFLASVPPQPNLDGLEKLRAASERFQLAGDVLYLHAPDGIGRSRLAAALERLLGVPMTSRNWNTVRKLGEMARAA